MDGGAQEWELRSSFNEEAEDARNWPRSRRILKELAETYEAEARRHDDEAERRQRGIGW